jgi:hypothetical protein
MHRPVPPAHLIPLRFHALNLSGHRGPSRHTVGILEDPHAHRQAVSSLQYKDLTPDG